jgi:hypothetical protein
MARRGGEAAVAGRLNREPRLAACITRAAPDGGCTARHGAVQLAAVVRYDDLQLAMHSPGDWVPCGSAAHSLAGRRVAAVHDGRLRRRRRRSAARDGGALVAGAKSRACVSVLWREHMQNTSGRTVSWWEYMYYCGTAAQAVREPTCANQQPAHTGGRGRVKWLVVAVET